MAEQDDPKIHVDSDWKQEAQREKERLAEESRGGEQGEGGGAQELPEASFEALVSTMATQALFALGAIADPRTGQPMQNLEMARYHIDLLGVLEDKTQNNLTDEERQLLSTTLYELRSRYVELNTGGGTAGGASPQGGGASPSGGGAGGSGNIITG
jgi:hypothetical protein